MGQNDFLTKKRAAEIVGKSTNLYNSDYAIKSYLLSEFSNGEFNTIVNSYKDTQFVEEKYWSKKESYPTYDTITGLINRGEDINGVPSDFIIATNNSSYNTDTWITFGKPQYEYGGTCLVFQEGSTMPGYKYTSLHLTNVYDFTSSSYNFEQSISSIYINRQLINTNPYMNNFTLGGDVINIFVFSPKGDSDTIKGWGFSLGLKENSFNDNVLETSLDYRIQVYETTNINDLPYGLCYDESQNKWWYVNYDNQIYWNGANTEDSYKTYLTFDN